MRAIDGDILEKKLKDAINMCVSIDTSGLSELKAVLEDVEEMPTIKPEQHWIPCSERLPVSDPDDLEYPTVIVCLADGSVTLACFYESTKEWGTGENFDCKCFPNKWMPLPEPYQEGES